MRNCVADRVDAQRHCPKHKASESDTIRRFQLRQQTTTQKERLDRSHCRWLARRARGEVAGYKRDPPQGSEQREEPDPAHDIFN